MTDTLTGAIAAHRVASVFGLRSTIGCLCGWRGTFDEHAEHVATAVREALAQPVQTTCDDCGGLPHNHCDECGEILYDLICDKCGEVYD